MANCRTTLKGDSLAASGSTDSDCHSEPPAASKKQSKDEPLENQLETDKRKSLEKDKSTSSQGKLVDDAEDNKATTGSNGGSEPVKQFDCSCGRTFVTQRGLSLHLSHYPDHRPDKKDTPTKPTAAKPTPTKPPTKPTPTKPVDPAPIENESTSPPPSPEEEPSSPYNYSSFKTSSRNPQYYSIIRTRSSSGVEGEGGTKRPRGPTTGGGGPPTKTLILNSGEKVPIGGDVSEDSDKDKESPLARRRSLKDTDIKRTGKKHTRARSANSEQISPKGSPEPEVGSSTGGGLKNSPVTRSNSATMKAPAFVSLPPSRRKGARRSGRGRGSTASGRGSEDTEIEDDGESFATSPVTKPEAPKTTEEEPPPPVKRKRGRPPKVRKSDESPTKKNPDTTKKQNKQNDEKIPLWENLDTENDINATTPTDTTPTTDIAAEEKGNRSFKTVALPKKGGNKESEKEPTKRRKSTQKAAEEEVPIVNEANEPATKRTRSKSKTKDASKTDSLDTANEGNKEEENVGKPVEETTTTTKAEEVPPVEEVKNEIEKPAEPDGRLMEPPPLPPTSSPTGYLHPYHYPGPYPHPPPIMYPPGPSSYHPYYGYPGGPPSGPYHMPPPPGMVVPAHPGPPMGDLSPHGGVPYPPQSGPTPTSGVQVSVLDKPPTQLPTVTVPLPTNRGRPMYMEGGHPGSPISPQAMMRPPYMPGMGSPEEMPHPLSHAYRPMPPMAGYHPMPHPQGPYHHAHPHLAVRLDHTGMPYMEWAPEHKPQHAQHPQPTHDEANSRPVECPECGRMFKNNKALNGHMRLHGGFDWTKKSPLQPYTAPEYNVKHAPLSMGGKPTTTTNNKATEEKPSNKKPKASSNNKRSRSNSRSCSPTPTSAKSSSKVRRTSDESKKKGGGNLTPLPVPRAPSVFTFDKVEREEGDTPSGAGGRNGTLDDLCRAAELLDSMEGKGGASKGPPTEEGELDENGRHRPKNITIPQTQSTPIIDRDKLRLGNTPPYTPPPILSPSRSLSMLSGSAGPAPGTPCRIMSHWSSRRSSDGHPLSESEETYNEPRINVGRDFQADLPPCSESNSTALAGDPKAVKVWQVIEDLTPEDEATIDGYLEIACSPAVLHSGRNKELALHLLYQLGGSVKEAVRCLLAGKTVFPTSHSMANYNYCGSGRWSARERQQFRRAWRVHRKQFHLLKSAVDSKSMPEMIEYYYTWKKYCSDEYRGRSRHFSEEILSDDEVGELRSSSSEASGDHETPPFSHIIKKNIKQEPYEVKGGKGRVLEPDFEHLPIVYAPHTSQPPGQSQHQYKCKYPGCNQIFTSIFALNGHIRVHGGSFYPKPFAPGMPSRASALHHATFNAAYTHQPQGRPSGKVTEPRSQQQLELAKALLELPRPRSPAKGMSYHTPSPKPSPKSRSPGVRKKLSSASPGERDGFYPCNRCGRVFTKVKSRSAHMKSHIVKQN
ncbi:nascent polypeptide-associated complex subunit alpha, muscle-specific form-like isoform X3 [Halichondria panicea]|uniref:nascent polypeptide-associated complex subunit alpha, muscle-specific form-like isoform X3 n=1 Tax=Halichondria panicea TaxID=6063 RepID=UPI00312BAEB5